MGAAGVPDAGAFSPYAARQPQIALADHSMIAVGALRQQEHLRTAGDLHSAFATGLKSGNRAHQSACNSPGLADDSKKWGTAVHVLGSWAVPRQMARRHRGNRGAPGWRTSLIRVPSWGIACRSSIKKIFWSRGIPQQPRSPVRNRGLFCGLRGPGNNRQAGM